MPDTPEELIPPTPPVAPAAAAVPAPAAPAAIPAADATAATAPAAVAGVAPTEPAAPATPPGALGPDEAAPFPIEKAKRGAIWAIGRRKTAVARVRIAPGTGKIMVNGRTFEAYFLNERERLVATQALRTTQTRERYDVTVNTNGGGCIGQAAAVLLGTARALLTAGDRFEPLLRAGGFLTRDSRKKERKHYGRRGARRAFQFSKR